MAGIIKTKELTVDHIQVKRGTIKNSKLNTIGLA
jgi:hypothetical protein